MNKILLLLLFLCCCLSGQTESGYRLWLRYDAVSNKSLLSTYQQTISSAFIMGNSASIDIARSELSVGLSGLLGKKIPYLSSLANNQLVVGTKAKVSAILKIAEKEYESLGDEGFMIKSVLQDGKRLTVITANTDVAVLYGVFQFLRLLQTEQSISSLNLISKPAIKLRVLNHWDNLNRHVERGYAGMSIWDWHRLPGYIDQRYIDYARTNASVGINGTVLTNVNASAVVLTAAYLEKVAALADVFRPYGIKVYLTARFSAPIEIGNLKTADPLNDEVRLWWKQKIDEIYKYVPDFGGFLVKANSEGQPGPQNYGRNHADGANMLADALEPHGGIVMWRAFVYSNESPEDRFKQAANEFLPLDGSFRKNVMVQVKNGPIDFQPREPFSPLFGLMKKTPLMMEFQITQEYLGQGTTLVYEAPMFKEVMNADTYAKGAGSTIAKVIEGDLYNHSLSGIAGVSNIGNDMNWTGHLFGQSNWYAFGRLAWEPSLSSSQIASEWLRQTFSNNSSFLKTANQLMMNSHETMVNYMTPLGLHHIMGTGHHYGPAPWINNLNRADWNPVYYHKADSFGIGFDRTAAGSDALAQYTPEVRKLYGDIRTCPEPYLLWFHHVSWKHKMQSGRNLWEELCYKYNAGVDSVRSMQKQWTQLSAFVDEERFKQVSMLLKIQEKEAVWWRNACLLYFQQFSNMAIPPQYERPDHDLEYYKGLRFPFAPGNG